MSKVGKLEDLIIIGSGPAGYAAALRAKHLKPVLFEGIVVGGIPAGGQLTTTTHVDNYPSFFKGIQGPDLMELIRNQALEAGIRIISRNVNFLQKYKNTDLIEVSAGKRKINAKCVIIATGSKAKRIYTKGTNNEELWQKGISACAVCDGKVFENKYIGVIGGGDTAMEEAAFLSNIAKKVFLFHRSEKFRARPDFVRKIRAIENVEFVVNKQLKEAKGELTLESVIMTDTVTGKDEEYKLSGLFFAIGHEPNTFFFSDKFIELYDNKYIVVKRGCNTSIKGVFAAGDVIDWEYRQAISAARSGAIAGMQAIEYLEQLKLEEIESEKIESQETKSDIKKVKK